MIFTERTITVVNDSATINKPLILYRGDKNIELKITIAESQFKFRNNDASNVIETTDASYAQLVINTPYNSPIFSDVAVTKNGAVIFVITEAMIDEIREVGAYEIQIRLLDDNKQSRASIPPVSNAIEIREPIAIEDGSAVDSNAVNAAKVNRALTTTSAPLEAFDSQGNYIKNNWGDGDPITDAALNKMETGIDGVNKKIGNVRSQINKIDKSFFNSSIINDTSSAVYKKIDIPFAEGKPYTITLDSKGKYYYAKLVSDYNTEYSNSIGVEIAKPGTNTITTYDFVAGNEVGIYLCIIQPNDTVDINVYTDYGAFDFYKSNTSTLYLLEKKDNCIEYYEKNKNELKNIIDGNILIDYVEKIVDDNTQIKLPLYMKKGYSYKIDVSYDGYGKMNLVSLYRDHISTDDFEPIEDNYKFSTTYSKTITCTKDYVGLRLLMFNGNKDFSIKITSIEDNVFSFYKNNKEKLLNNYINSNKKIAILGDSIMYNMASLIAEQVDMDMIDCNGTHCFALGNATACDYFDENSNNITPIDLSTIDCTPSPYNTLSNQVRRLAQWTTPLGEIISWNVLSDNTTVTIPSEKGLGLGHIEDVPDVIYIAISTNDYNWVNDVEDIESQNFSQLKRNSIASALRWAIDSLQTLYPNAIIYVATPLQNADSGTDKNERFGYKAEKSKANIIREIAQFCCVYCVDTFSEFSYGRNYINGVLSDTELKPNSWSDNDNGLHPNKKGNFAYSRYIAKQIKNKFYNRYDDDTLLYD